MQRREAFADGGVEGVVLPEPLGVRGLLEPEVQDVLGRSGGMCGRGHGGQYGAWRRWPCALSGRIRPPVRWRCPQAAPCARGWRPAAARPGAPMPGPAGGARGPGQVHGRQFRQARGRGRQGADMGRKAEGRAHRKPQPGGRRPRPQRSQAAAVEGVAPGLARALQGRRDDLAQRAGPVQQHQRSGGGRSAGLRARRFRHQGASSSVPASAGPIQCRGRRMTGSARTQERSRPASQSSARSSWPSAKRSRNSVLRATQASMRTCGCARAKRPSTAGSSVSPTSSCSPSRTRPCNGLPLTAVAASSCRASSRWA